MNMPKKISTAGHTFGSLLVRHCCFQLCEPFQCGAVVPCGNINTTIRQRLYMCPDMCKYDNTNPATNQNRGASSGTGLACQLIGVATS